MPAATHTLHERPSRRVGPWIMIAMLALAGHAVLLGMVPLGLGDGATGGVPAPMQARRIVLAPPVAPALIAEPPLRSPPQQSPAAPLPSAATVPSPALAAASAAEAAPAEEPTTAALPPDSGGGDVPTYATRMPPAAVLKYELKRGALVGQAVLVWRPREDGYNLSLEGTVFAQPVIAWVSQGGFDADGLAPERFVDKRRSRDARAANFQRDKGRITFSGPRVDFPLVPGAQDRLSWMVQLAAVIEANTAHYIPGEHISFFVAGARGDADIWVFNVEAQVDLELPNSRVENALRLRREPRKPYDTMVEVWLDPARHHLPVRLRLSIPQTGDSTDFLLLQSTLLPT